MHGPDFFLSDNFLEKTVYHGWFLAVMYARIITIRDSYNCLKKKLQKPPKPRNVYMYMQLINILIKKNSNRYYQVVDIVFALGCCWEYCDKFVIDKHAVTQG